VLAVFTAPAAWRAIVGAAGTPAPSAADIVILPFTVHGGADAGFLGEGMVDLLGAKLNGAGGLRAVDPQALLTVLRSLPDRPADLGLGRDVARRFQAGHFIMGSVVQAGTSLQISAYLYDDDGQLIGRADAVTAADSGLFALVDDLARTLLAGRFTDEDAPIAGLAALTTSSLPALRAYLDGERFFRSGDYTSAIEALQGAVAIDSTFALAYYRLSSAADWVGRANVSEPAARAAMRHADRLPAADRALVVARHEYWFGDAARAAALYRELAATQPYEVEGWFELGEVLFHAGPWFGRSLTEAGPAFRRVLELHPRHAAAMVHLARVAAVERNVALLDSLLQALDAAEPTHSGIDELQALRAALVPGGRPEARPETQRPGTATAERVAVYTGNLGAATELATQFIPFAATTDDRALVAQSLSHLYAAQGRWREAKRQLAALEAIDPGIAAQVFANIVGALPVPPPRADIVAARDALARHPPADEPDAPSADPGHFARARHAYHLGVLSLMLGEPVEPWITRLDTAQGSNDARTFSRNLAATLRARRLVADGNAAAALGELERSWLPPRKPLMIGWAWTHANVNARLLRAQLLAQLNRGDEALRWLDAVTEDIAGSPLILPQVHLLRARIHDAAGRREEAAAGYEAFLQLWEGADPEWKAFGDEARRRHVALR